MVHPKICICAELLNTLEHIMAFEILKNPQAVMILVHHKLAMALMILVEMIMMNVHEERMIPPKLMHHRHWKLQQAYRFLLRQAARLWITRDDSAGADPLAELITPKLVEVVITFQMLKIPHAFRTFETLTFWLRQAGDLWNSQLAFLQPDTVNKKGEKTLLRAQPLHAHEPQVSACVNARPPRTSTPVILSAPSSFARSW